MFETHHACLADQGIGILLIGHGTREEAGQAEFLATAPLIRQRFPNVPVEPTYLELAKPTITEGWTKLVKRGVRRIAAVPVLLFAAGHAKKDIPRILADCSSRSGSIPWTQSEPLGCHPTILQQSSERYAEAVGHNGDRSKTLLVLVGRGSLDAEATAEMHRFAALCSAVSRPRELRVAFLAMAQPRLVEILQQRMPEGVTTVVVQPHLLYAGQLLADIVQQVREARQRCPMIDWRIAGHLGSTPLVVDALLERLVQSIRQHGANGTPEATVVEERV